VFEWIDSLVHRRANVTVRARLYADSHADNAEPVLRGPARANAQSEPTPSARAAAAAQRSTPATSLEPLVPRVSWFPRDGASARDAGASDTRAA
jgi:hypothetical protein